jgi:hypothetical protein
MEAPLRVTEGLERLKGVFLEIPGTQMNVADAARLSGLDHALCGVILSALEDARFLRRGRDGLYQRSAISDY